MRLLNYKKGTFTKRFTIMIRVSCYWPISLLLLCSCLSYKNQIYFKSDEFTEGKPTLIKNEPLEYRLQPNDVLSIKVQSLDPQVSNFFNIDNTSIQRIGNDPASLYLSGYSIDDQGFVTLPTVGKLMVKNLTIHEAQDLVQKTIDEYLKNAIVLVKLVSFKISVLGEVFRAGSYFIYNNQATLPEALSLAGDLTEFGNRKSVKLIRQVSDGSEVILLDLTDPELLHSKYYYLLPNDIVYVEPKKARADRSNLTPVNVFFGALSTVIAVLATLDIIN